MADEAKFRGRIQTILDKLNDPDSVQSAEREMKAFVVSEITDWDRLQVLITTIAENDTQVDREVRKDQIKLYIIVAEVFQFQIIEYLPSIFTILNEKLGKEADSNVVEAIGETYAGLLEHSLKKSSKEDSVFVIEEATKTLFQLCETGSNTQQVGAATSILKIVASAPSPHFIHLAPFLFENLIKNLKRKKQACTLQCLESLMSLVLFADKEIPNYLDSILGVLIEQVCSNNPEVRRVALDIIHSLCVVSPGEMKFYKEEMIDTVQVVKNDPDKSVLEASQEAIKAIRALDGDSSERDRSSLDKVSISSKSKQEQKALLTSSVVNPSASKVPPSKKLGPKKEYGINKMKMNPNFMKAGTDDIEIFVNDKQSPPPTFAMNHSAPIFSDAKLPESISARNRYENMATESLDAHGESEFQIESRIDPTHANMLAMTLGSEGPSRIPKVRIEEESNMFRDFDDTRDRRRSVERSRGNSKERRTNEDVIEYQASQKIQPAVEQRQERSKSPENFYQPNYPVERPRRMLMEDHSEIEHLRDLGGLTGDNALQRANRTHDQEIKKLKKNYETLQKENAAQAKIIDFQNKRLDTLVSHVQNMTLHINHLLGKVNQMEQNVFQISNNRQQSPQQIILPNINYPMGSNSPTGADANMYGHGQMQQMPNFPQGLYQQQYLQGQQNFQQSKWQNQGQAKKSQPPQLPHFGRFPADVQPLSQVNMNPGKKKVSQWEDYEERGEKRGRSKRNKWKVRKESSVSEESEEEEEHVTRKRTRGDKENDRQADRKSKSKSRRREEDRGRQKKERDGSGWQEKEKSEQPKGAPTGQKAGRREEPRGGRTAPAVKVQTIDVTGGGNQMELEKVNQVEEEAEIEEEEKMVEEEIKVSEEEAEATEENQEGDDEISEDELDDDQDQEEEEDEQGEEEEEENEEDKYETQLSDADRKKIKEINEYLNLVLTKENRKVLDFLSDYDNLDHFHLVDSVSMRRLLSKLADLLATRVESHISISVPWLQKAINLQRVDSKEDASKLLTSVKQILSGGKASKMYQQETLVELEKLKSELEWLA